MQQFKYFFIFIISSFLLTANICYSECICPDSTSFYKAGAKQANISDDGFWYAYTDNDNFGTDKTWHFFVGPFRAKSEAAAIEKANAALKDLSFKSIDQNSKTITCEYRSYYENLFIFGTAISLKK